MAVILIVFWTQGLVSVYMLCGFVHLLLLLAILVIIIRVIKGRIIIKRNSHV